ncbi:hypothetical protein M2G44_12100 [Vibrio vulnificus]|nr:hypothetical protein [Vibrio vulnificus]
MDKQNMRIARYTLYAACLISSTFVVASSDKQQILEQLKSLQEQGVTQYEAYKYSDSTQLKQCTEAAKPLRDEAKQLQQTILKSNDVIFRMPAYQAADLAFQCVYCAENALSYCEKMTKYITRVEKSLSK